LFSAILIANFPKILREFALSRAAYKLAQDIRKTQDLGLSGVQMTDGEGQPILAKGYGIYVDLSISPAEDYLIYADRGEPHDFKYDGGSLQFCSDNATAATDCILEDIDVSQSNPDLFIKDIRNLKESFSFVSINFSPPNPVINIDNLQQGFSEIGVVLGLKSDDSFERTIWVNTSGLIRVK